MVQEYNYEAYDFTADGEGVERWRREGPRPGRAAPGFELPTVDGQMVSLASLAGRPVVLEFGSFTCPMFCGQVPAMEGVAERHPEATFLVVYTREAHPGELTPAHRSIEDKRRAVEKLVRTEGMQRTVLVDSVDGEVHRAYGGASNSVYLIGPDGAILSRRAWNDPDEVDRALAALAAGLPVDPSEATEMARTDRWAFGYGILRGGRRALLDFYESGPPALKERLRASASDEVRAALPETPA